MNVIAPGMTWNNGNIYFWINVPVPMRVPPTISLANSSNLALGISTTYGIQYAPTDNRTYSNLSVSCIYSTGTTINFDISPTDTTSNLQPLMSNKPFLYCQYSANALNFSAEL
jgi:hypothetical protein